jgi:hypothetical protein
MTCGVWMGHRTLVAAVVENDGRVVSTPRLPKASPERWCALLTHLDEHVGLDYELVLPDWLARHDGIAQVALAHQVSVWVVPHPLVDAICTVGRLTTGPPVRIAAALARIPLAPALRAHLARIAPADRRQLALL